MYTFTGRSFAYDLELIMPHPRIGEKCEIEVVGMLEPAWFVTERDVVLARDWQTAKERWERISGTSLDDFLVDGNIVAEIVTIGQGKELLGW